MKNLSILTAAAVLSLAPAAGDVVPVSLVYTPGLPFSKMDYEAGLTFSQQLKPGDYFILLDLPTLSSVGVIPADFLSFIEPLSVQPAGISLFDDPLISNVRFVYAGTGKLGPQSLGIFELLVDADSVLTTGSTYNWIGSGHQLDELGGRSVANINVVDFPTNVPETIPAAGLAVAALALTRRQRRAARR